MDCPVRVTSESSPIGMFYPLARIHVTLVASCSGLIFDPRFDLNYRRRICGVIRHQDGDALVLHFYIEDTTSRRVSFHISEHNQSIAIEELTKIQAHRLPLLCNDHAGRAVYPVLSKIQVSPGYPKPRPDGQESQYDMGKPSNQPSDSMKSRLRNKARYQGPCITVVVHKGTIAIASGGIIPRSHRNREFSMASFEGKPPSHA